MAWSFSTMSSTVLARGINVQEGRSSFRDKEDV